MPSIADTELSTANTDPSISSSYPNRRFSPASCDGLPESSDTNLEHTGDGGPLSPVVYPNVATSDYNRYQASSQAEHKSTSFSKGLSPTTSPYESDNVTITTSVYFSSSPSASPLPPRSSFFSSPHSSSSSSSALWWRKRTMLKIKLNSKY